MSAAIRPADPAAIAEAAAILRRGGLVAFPTETVYGLGADAGNDVAVANIFAAKGRPRFNPLIVHVSDPASARALAHFPAQAVALAARFWPGPLTLVLPRREEAPLSLLVSAGLATVALRVPSQPVARALLAALGRPIAAPSANRFSAVSPTNAQHVAADLGDRIDLILDDGPCVLGLESTIVAVADDGVEVLRPGGVPLEDIESVVGPIGLAAVGKGGAPRAPGMLKRHYAPGRPLRLNATEANPGEALLGFGATHHATLNLSPTGDLREAAAHLFAMLRELDKPGVAAIAVAPIPEGGLGLAINDRLRRAAAREDERDDWQDGRGPSAPCRLPGIDPDGD